MKIIKKNWNLNRFILVLVPGNHFNGYIKHESNKELYIYTRTCLFMSPMQVNGWCLATAHLEWSNDALYDIPFPKSI